MLFKMFLKQNMLFFGVISGPCAAHGPKIKGYLWATIIQKTNIFPRYKQCLLAIFEKIKWKSIIPIPFQLNLFSFFNNNINKN